MLFTKPFTHGGTLRPGQETILSDECLRCGNALRFVEEGGAPVRPQILPDWQEVSGIRSRILWAAAPVLISCAVCGGDEVDTVRADLLAA